ncbi:GTP 3',8-cyclase MoaA [Prolixibacteraceae bacterium JC049]|nr:GTP 3',8-cyclase MoaA [Prolixibacteraceae bacterium JC049]
MYDRFNRDISYLRISVTDRCNLRCRYCMPEEGISRMAHDDILSFEEMVDVVKRGVARGIKKVRLTGGEPLVRKGIVELVRMIREIDGVEELNMTTNGILLDKYAKDLKAAGLDRINISLDTMNAKRYKYITRGGNIQDVLKGIDAAINAGLSPVKLNCVVRNHSDEPDAKAVKEFAASKGLKVRFIHQMDLETGHFSIVEGGEGGNCKTCNRLRLTADGNIKPCLFSDKAYDVKDLGVEEAYNKAITNKPEEGSKNQSNQFYNIGG